MKRGELLTFHGYPFMKNTNKKKPHLQQPEMTGTSLRALILLLSHSLLSQE